MQPTYYVKHPDGTFTPVDVPAASVQPVPTEWRGLAEQCLKSMRQAVHFGKTGQGRPPQQTCLFEIEALEKMLAVPDSGRDAALEEAAALVDSKHSTISDPAIIGASISEAAHNVLTNIAAAIRALAAHPANVARAQTEQRQRERMTQRFADRTPSAATADFDLPAPNDAINVAQPVSDAARDYNDKLRQEVSMMFQMLDAGEWAEHVAVTSHGQCLETAITRLVSRANVAQVGDLSEEQIDEITAKVRENHSCYADESSLCIDAQGIRNIVAAILATAKKGGA